MTLGLGIGVNTAIFSIVDGVLLRELPYRQPDRLVRITTHFKGQGGDANSEANFLDYRSRLRSLGSVAAVTYSEAHFDPRVGEPVRLQWGVATVQFLAGDTVPRLQEVQVEDSLKTASGLAELRLRQGDVAASDTLITHVLEAQAGALGDQHPDVLGSMTTLARVRNAQQRFAEAEELSERAVDLGSRALGADHPLVLDATLEKIHALRGQERLEEAVELAPGVYTRRVEKLGKSIPTPSPH